MKDPLLAAPTAKFVWTFNHPDSSARRSNQSILKEISPGISLEGMMLKLKLQYFGHLMRRAESLEKTLMLGGIGGTTHVARLEFPRETGLILRCAGKAGNPFQTTQSCPQSFPASGSFPMTQLFA